MSVNQTQDPTPEQEAIYERDCEIAALKEQIVEAMHIINEIENYPVSESLLIQAVLWLQRNAD